MSDTPGVSETGTEKRAQAPTPPPGVTPPSAASGREGFLSDVIVELGFATPETVEEAVRAARSPGTTVAHVLVETKSISEDQLARATAERYGIDYVDLEAFEVNPAAANLIDAEAARRHGAVPVGFFGRNLMVAMADPADAPVIDEIAALSGHDVRPAVASRPALDALLESLPLDQPAGAPEQPEPAAAGERAVAESEGDSPLRAELGALKHQLAGAEAELDGARSRVREAKEVSAELETLREALAAAEAGLHARTREGDPTPGEAAELQARLGSMKSERDLARSQMREVESQLRRIVADVEGRSGELHALRARLTEAEIEVVRLRADLETRGFELEAMRSRAESAEARAESAEARAKGGWRRSSHGGRALGERDLLDMLDEEKTL
jgi:phage shock protein A